MTHAATTPPPRDPDGSSRPAARIAGISGEVEFEELVRTVVDVVADQDGDVDALVRNEVRRRRPLARAGEQAVIVASVLAELRGLGPLQAHVADPDIDEVMVNRGAEIWIDRRGHLEQVGVLRHHRLDDLIERILAPIGRRVDRRSPIVDARLPDGARVCAVVPPVAVDGPCLAIRRFADEVRPIDDFASDDVIGLCHDIVAARCNLVISGATSSGKTSLLAALADTVRHERLVVAEDTAELPLHGDHVVRLEARPASPDVPQAVTLDDLVRAALRLRPDRLVVGEIRGDEVLALVQAMNTGHDGSWSTCHANGPLDTLLRLESLVLRAAPTWPMASIREQLLRSVDVIIHVARDGAQRRITAVAELAPPELAGGDGPPVRLLTSPTAAGVGVVDELRRRRR